MRIDVAWEQEQKSRVDACHAYDYVNINRYTCAMADDGVDLHHWRKSNLFMLLTRKHAEMFRDDQVIYKSFQVFECKLTPVLVFICASDGDMCNSLGNVTCLRPR